MIPFWLLLVAETDRCMHSLKPSTVASFYFVGTICWLLSHFKAAYVYAQLYQEKKKKRLLYLYTGVKTRTSPVRAHAMALFGLYIFLPPYIQQYTDVFCDFIQLYIVLCWFAKFVHSWETKYSSYKFTMQEELLHDRTSPVRRNGGELRRSAGVCLVFAMIIGSFWNPSCT